MHILLLAHLHFKGGLTQMLRFPVHSSIPNVLSAAPLGADRVGNTQSLDSGAHCSAAEKAILVCLHTIFSSRGPKSYIVRDPHTWDGHEHGF